MAVFILGLIIFFGVHLWTALARSARSGLIGKFGEGVYKGLYSLVAAVGFALIIVGWRGADVSLLYSPPSWARHVTYALMLVALICLASAYLPKGRVAPALKHPMLAGVKIWAAGHLLANGEMRSVILFGAFLAFAVIDRIAVKSRGEAIPAAGPPINDVLTVVVGSAAWAGVYFYAHPFIAGVALT